MTDNPQSNPDGAPVSAAEPATDVISPARPLSGDIATLALDGVIYYVLTSLIVFLGVAFGHHFLKLSSHVNAKRVNLLGAFANWDGEWYTKIVMDGYSYDPNQMSSVAFFPLFPCLARILVELTGLKPEWALLTVSHLFLAATFVLMFAYIRQRFTSASPRLGELALLAFGLFPTTFFFRMAYTESLFVFLALLVFIGMERRWGLLEIAILIGLATASRSVAVALIPCLIIHVREQSPSTRVFLGRLCYLVPIACWGICAYMVYQFACFGEPFAFVKTQAHWSMRPAISLEEKAAALVSLEPLWSVYDPRSPCYCARREPQISSLFSLYLANPLYILLTFVLVITGKLKGWINGKELLFSVLLLLIPYVTRGYESCMASNARYAAGIFPVYLSLGHLLGRLPGHLSSLLLALSGFLLGAYSALFAAWYRFY